MEGSINSTDTPAKPRGQGPDEETLRALRASELAGRAEKLLGEGDIARARALAQEAHELDGSMAEYQALLGYTMGLSGREELEAGLGLLDEAIQRDAFVAQAYHWRGVLRRRLGLEDMAVADFEKAVELRPSHIDAQREVRASLLPAAQRDPTGSFRAASVDKAPKSGSQAKPGDKQKVVALAAAVCVLLLALGGGTATVVDLPTAPQLRIREMLISNDQKGLDAMGAVGASQIALLLTNSSSVGGRSYRELANEYLLHYAAVIDKRPPPELAKQSNPDWSALKNAWMAWLSRA